MSIAAMISKHGEQVVIQSPQRGETITASKTLIGWKDRMKFKGWVQPVSSSLARDYHARQIEVSHSIYCFANPNIRAGERLLGEDGLTYNVRGDSGKKGQAGLGRLFRIDVVQLA